MQEFADNLGITRDTLTRQINGNPTIETLQKIADALNVHISDLFEKPNEEVEGFLKVRGELKEIKSIKDLEDIISTIKP